MAVAVRSREGDRQDVYFDRIPIRRDPFHPVVRAFARQRLEVLEQIIARSRVRTILDVGCGSGTSSVSLSEWGWVVGADRSQRMLSHNPIPRKVRCDVGRLPFRDAAFDLVAIWEVLHHLPDPSPAVAEAARVARHYVAVFEPNRSNPAQALFALLQPEHRWVFGLSIGRLETIMVRAGLRVIAAFTGGWIFPNRMPAISLPLVRRLPYRWPLGISIVLIGERS